MALVIFLVILHVFYLIAFGVSLYLSFGWAVVPVVLSSLYFVDFGSGLAHILLDNKLFLKEHHREACKALVPNEKFDDLNVFTRIVYDFQIHHYDQRSILNTPFYSNEVSGYAMKTLLLPSLLINYVCWVYSSGLVALFFNALFFVAAHAQMIHHYSHMRNDERPKFVKFLQKVGLILPVRPHARHHVPPHECDFGIVNGWSNPVLNVVYKIVKRFM